MPDDKKKKIINELEDLPGIGEATAEKLRKAGYEDITAIAAASPHELAEAGDFGVEAAKKAIDAAKESLDVGFETADIIFERRRNISRITTGSKALDEMLGGGLETQSITECFGRFSSGKCIAKDTTVLYFNNEHSHLEPIEEVYNRYVDQYGEKPYEEGFIIEGAPISVISLTNEGLTKERATHLYKERVNKIVRIETMKGRVLEVTLPHRLLTVTKAGVVWKQAGEITRNEAIACPRQLFNSITKNIKNYTMGRQRAHTYPAMTVNLIKTIYNNTLHTILPADKTLSKLLTSPPKYKLTDHMMAKVIQFFKAGENYLLSLLKKDRNVAVDKELKKRLADVKNGIEQLKVIAYFNWDTVKQANILDYNDFVYDFVVPNGHTFIGGNLPTLLHNSQLGFQLSVNVQKSPEHGGINGKVLFIDSEGTFRPDRIAQIAEAAKMDPDQVLKGIFVKRAENSDHQILLVDRAEKIIAENGIKLIVVDSLTSHFRADYIGRGALSDRQQKLNKHIHLLQKLADKYNLAVYVTNQVMDNPGILFGDPTVPIGGHVIAHAATYRIYLRKSKEEKRIARLVDSPNLPEAECVFKVTKDGIKD